MVFLGLEKRSCLRKPVLPNNFQHAQRPSGQKHSGVIEVAAMSSEPRQHSPKKFVSSFCNAFHQGAGNPARLRNKGTPC
jgi:hypothetical protein